MTKNIDIPNPRTFPLKSIKQRKLGIIKQSSSQSQQQLQQSSQITKTTSTTKSIPTDNLEYLQNLTNRILFDIGKGNKLKKLDKEQSLPPLTSSNNLDIKLYALFSLLLNNFVYGWYRDSLNLGNKNEFTKELIFIFAHICRNLQERINNSKDELIKLLVIDLPYLLTEHVESIDDVWCLLAKDGAIISNEIHQDDYFINEWMARYSDGLNNDENYLTYRRFVIKSIVCLILPHENINSNISREFVTSLLDGIVLKNIIESFCDSFVFWEIIGKISTKLITLKKEKTRSIIKKSKIHIILEFFIIEDKYQVKPDDMLDFSNFIPLISFINLLSMFDLRFPILMSIIQVIFQVMLKIDLIKRFINNTIKRFVFENILNENNLEAIVDLLRHMMFPDDDKFEMKARYIPQNDEELQALYEENLKYFQNFLSSNSKFSKLFISDEDENNKNIIKEKAKYVFSVFKNKRINQVLVRKIIDLLLVKIFPELQIQDAIGTYIIHH
ncbi:hypothetical protein C6P40_001217 [Pichia californica]|uniref:PXA domain-containing protein n=1 Tax=Pichia californica TaxID=460514 RepID=A0A9P6WJH9_9ASCO|nr:hypothetical protein C6P40_001217 [[Candida] californica]